MDNHFEPLAIGEVLSVDESAQIFIGHHTFRVDEFADAIQKQLQSVDGWTKEKDAWFSEDGIPCEVLRFSANGWQKGKVRIHLEFCPQDFEDKPKETSASVANASSPSVLVDSSDDLDLGDSLLDSSDDLDLEESPFAMKDELVSEDFSISVEPELDLGTSSATAFDQEGEAPTAIFVEMEREVIILPGNEFEMAPVSSHLDDDLDLGQISQSIEHELELVEAPMPTEEEMLDLGAMSLDSNDDLDFGEMSGGSDEDFEFGEISTNTDDDLDFGEISGSEDDFQFEDLSLNNETEGNENDSLLDDVWQDINQASWQNNH
ncbi:MAG: hypothetical protein M3O33_01570 [Cyanobacteriota bacterium]|nr:hypothetical protein [Cyanobacteriota bacterium]